MLEDGDLNSEQSWEADLLGHQSFQRWPPLLIDNLGLDLKVVDVRMEAGNPEMGRVDDDWNGKNLSQNLIDCGLPAYACRDHLLQRHLRSVVTYYWFELRGRGECGTYSRGLMAGW